MNLWGTSKSSLTEVLEALERGEMKFESNGCVLSCSEDEDEDEEVDPLSIDTPPTSTVGTVKVGADELPAAMRCYSSVVKNTYILCNFHLHNLIRFIKHFIFLWISCC